MKKYIVSVASCLFALCMQSCFQDMDHPAFDYPESTGEVPTSRFISSIRQQKRMMKDGLRQK